jgi:hypothetical protein
MPLVGFELTMPVFERAKTDHALDRAASVIGEGYYWKVKFTFLYFKVISVWSEESRIECLKINFAMNMGFQVDDALMLHPGCSYEHGGN